MPRSFRQTAACEQWLWYARAAARQCITTAQRSAAAPLSYILLPAKTVTNTSRGRMVGAEVLSLFFSRGTDVSRYHVQLTHIPRATSDDARRGGRRRAEAAAS